MSLYIKDRETAELAAEVARRTGKTKTAVVREALTEYKQQLLPEDGGKSDFVEWYHQYRREHPLPPRSGLAADKPFYDSLYDDD